MKRARNPVKSSEKRVFEAKKGVFQLRAELNSQKANLERLANQVGRLISILEKMSNSVSEHEIKIKSIQRYAHKHLFLPRIGRK
jgi:septal ring factor EnvC (AmiA/AmiB activator)